MMAINGFDMYNKVTLVKGFQVVIKSTTGKLFSYSTTYLKLRNEFLATKHSGTGSVFVELLRKKSKMAKQNPELIVNNNKEDAWTSPKPSPRSSGWFLLSAITSNPFTGHREFTTTMSCLSQNVRFYEEVLPPSGFARSGISVGVRKSAHLHSE